MLACLVQLGVQNNGFGDAIEGQVAGDLCGVFAGHVDAGRGEGDHFRIVCAKEILGHEMIKAAFPTGQHGAGWHGDGDAGGFGVFLVKGDFPFETREHAIGGGETEVVVAEHDLAVACIQGVGFGGGKCGGGGGAHQGSGEKSIFHHNGSIGPDCIGSQLRATGPKREAHKSQHYLC